ncbi:hypothetical protein MNAN1_001497 [Malassezia nana]|uniref:C2H2-type domain-containing protein n=1 Tax=Malassezia nana TaxID=180528 RepID=A0AAF0J232_9BASI|nr:hypothetical protein MNAN1_001497 [Malassezia nana]
MPMAPAPVALDNGSGHFRSATDAPTWSDLSVALPGREALSVRPVDTGMAPVLQSEPPMLTSLAGSDSQSWQQPQALWHGTSQPVVALPMSAPMINVSMATPHPLDGTNPAAVPFSSPDLKGQAPTFYTSDPHSPLQGSPVTGSNSDTSQSGWDYPNDPAASMGPISLHQALRHHAHNENFKGLLKLDVNMGFAGDTKMESPTTMLHPVGPGWKKRRSTSDVGPRTPSLLGPSIETFTSPVDDLSYLIQSMGGKATSPREITAPAMAPAASTSGINFESLNLHTEESPPSASPPTVLTVQGNVEKAELPLPHSEALAPAPELTLNPSLIHTPGSNDVIRKSLMQVFHDPMYTANASEENLSGPVRHGSKSPRPLSPYHASTRSVTPESEQSFDTSNHNDAAARMLQWRFPFSGSSQNLHPMDAYGPGSMLLSGRHPSTSRNPRRHLRTSVSEDFHGRMKPDPFFPVTNSLDLKPHELSMLTPLQGGLAGSSDMTRCLSSPGRSVSHEKPPAVGVSLSSLEEYNTMVDAQVEPDSTSHPSSRSPSAHSQRDKNETVFQSASQTRTPVVTTSASQAASASRRKAEALFTCPFPDCDSTFTRQYNLRGHLRSHLDERPFKCEWPGCGRSFARVHDCKRHHNLHLNIKPYQCEGCQKTFARLDALNRHYKSEASTCGTKAAQKASKSS